MQPIRIFISYSRRDKDVVDRLERDLSTIGFETWIDRKEILGGTSWEDEIVSAIASCHVFLLVMSPDSIGSKVVHAEWLQALNLNKVIMPIMIKDCSPPFVLAMLHYINFEILGYTKAFQELVRSLEAVEPYDTLPAEENAADDVTDVPHEDAILFQPREAPPPPEPSLNDLWISGAEALQQGDMERAARLWERVVVRDATFLKGTVAKELQKLQPELVKRRIQRLVAIANEACQQADWGREAGAWEEVLRVQPRYADAKKRRDLAVLHQELEHYYHDAKRAVEQERLDAAKALLTMLYQQAPYYGDAEGVAETLGLGIYKNYYDGQVAEVERKKLETQVQSEYKKRVQNARQRNSDAVTAEKARREASISAKRNAFYGKETEVKRITSQIELLKKQAQHATAGNTQTTIFGCFIFPVAISLAFVAVAAAVFNVNVAVPLSSEIEALRIGLTCGVPLLWMYLTFRRRNHERDNLLYQLKLKEQQKARLETELKQLRYEAKIPEPVDPVVVSGIAQGLGTLASNPSFWKFVGGILKRG